ncbi:MAG TPA: UDP-N-acetylglucosamine 2-epimerase (non-hydrolyzing) [Gaiellaceae bacterium]
MADRITVPPHDGCPALFGSATLEAILLSMVCFVVGARPNFMKAAPVLRALADQAPEVGRLLVHTGQHYDREMSEVFLAELGLPTPDVSLGIGSGSHAEQSARVLMGLEPVLLERRPDLVVVVGDVNSTLASALTAVKLDLPVAHVESGLRSFDPRMPEEHNRKLTDHLSTGLLAHSQSAVENLRNEGIDDARVHLVGNTMIDTLVLHLDRARSEAPWEAWNLSPREYGLVTLHRPALVDDERLLGTTVEALIALSADRPLLFPVHPRTRARIESACLAEAIEASGVILTEPLAYGAFLGLEAEAAFVLTDSGGVQEETSVLRIRCFTLRDNTERPVTVELGTNIVLGAQPERIAEIPSLLAAPVQGDPIPLWDGRAGERAAAVLLKILG